MDVLSNEVNSELDLYIEGIELHGFLGFAKPRIKVLKATFDKKLQILNSSNGCGKTTFISELNIFPIDKDLFELDGFKIVTFKVNGKRYRVESNHKRNFLYDDETNENLNDGGTKTQHLALIKQLFGLTPFLWAAAMGGINFTDADKNTRRLWIETISKIDFNYPFETYKKITTELNGLKGAAKHLNIQLTTEAAKLLNEDEVIKLIGSKDILSNTVKQLLLSRDTSISKTDKYKLEREIQDLEHLAKTTQLNYNRLARFINPFAQVTSIESLRDYHAELSNERNLLDQAITNTIDKVGERNALLNKLDKGKGIDIDEVKAKVKEFTETLGIARGQIQSGKLNKDLIPYLGDLKVAQGFLGDIGLIYNEVLEHLTSTKDYDDTALVYPFDKSTYEQLVGDRDSGTIALTRWKLRVEQLELNLKELTGREEVECPKCTTTFIPNASNIDDIVKELDDLNIKINTYTPKVAELVEQILTYETVVDKRRYTLDYLGTFFKSEYNWYVHMLQEYLETDKTLVELGTKLRVDETTTYYLEMGITSKAELERLNHIMKEYEAVTNVVDAHELDKEIKDLNLKVAELRARRTELASTLREVNDAGTLYKKHIELLMGLKNSLEALTLKRTTYTKVLTNVALEAVEDDLQRELATITKKVNDNEILINLISSLDGMLADTKDKIETLKVLDQAFNPATGIIAEQLVGYVSAFSTQLTTVISKLWGYPMTILPCKIEARKGMDYRFPFKIGDKPTPDVSKGSKSQVSVINLAVMLCTRISLGLNGLPLFLDEVGGGFDTVHNQKLTEFIQELLASYGCSNVFLVHHDAAVRNSLGPRDTIVFDASQVIVEPGYNQNVVITYLKGAAYEDTVH